MAIENIWFGTSRDYTGGKGDKGSWNDGKKMKLHGCGVFGLNYSSLRYKQMGGNFVWEQTE